MVSLGYIAKSCFTEGKKKKEGDKKIEGSINHHLKVETDQWVGRAQMVQLG